MRSTVAQRVRLVSLGRGALACRLVPEPTAATSTEDGRIYTDADGREYPSVTTVIGAMSREELDRWYARMAAERAVNNLAHVSSLTRVKGITAAVGWVSEAAVNVRDEAGFLGSDIHDLIERRINGWEIPSDLSEYARGMLNQWERFAIDFDFWPVCSEASGINRTMGYAGTMDTAATLNITDGRVHIVDWKSGEKGPRPEVAIQTKGYAGLEVLLNEDLTEYPMVEVDQDLAYVLKIRPDKYELREVDITYADRMLAALITVYHWQRNKNWWRLRKVTPADSGLVAGMVSQLMAARTVRDVEVLYHLADGDGLLVGDLLQLFTERKDELAGKESTHE